MEFKTEAQKAVWEKTKTYASEIFGEMASIRDDRLTFVVTRGSAFAATIVLPWGDDDATVCTRSYVVTSINKTFELMDFLLSVNNDVRFGAFGLDADGDVFFEHTVVGSTLDKAELRASVMAVLATADSYDDQIVAKFGGLRATDR